MPIRKEFRKFYGKKWREEIRPKVQARAGDCCEQCGAENGRLGKWRDGRFYPAKIQCGAAHLDHNPENNADANLAWLCRYCHLKTDAGQHRETRSARKDRARPLLQEATTCTF
jgi:hypothetical protein